MFGIQQDSVGVFSDSQSATFFTKNQMFHEKGKHIDIWLHFVRDMISTAKVKVKKIHIEDNPADILTKAVTIDKFRRCLNLIGVTKVVPG